MENGERKISFVNERDCANCKHYKLYKDNDLYACESWECKYEPRDKED